MAHCKTATHYAVLDLYREDSGMQYPRPTMKESKMEATSREAIDSSFLTLGKHASSPSPTLTKIQLVQFRNGEAVDKHPELTGFIDDGWTIRSAVPRIVESEGTKLLVVLAKAHAESGSKTIRPRKQAPVSQIAG